MVIVAHPDDETIGFSATLAAIAPSCTLVHVTNGAPKSPEYWQRAGFASREEYAEARRNEMFAAVAEVGLSPSQCITLGFSDREAALHMAPLTRELHELLKRFEPRSVVTHPFEGGHPDHDATAFAVHSAIQRLARDGASPPALWELTSYHRVEGQRVVFDFLSPSAETISLTLSADERARKARMYQAYRSQDSILALFPIGVERLRTAPAYDFTRPPHAGATRYGTSPSSMTFEAFCELARQAGAELG